MEKFIITPREDKTVTMTIRIDRTLQERYNQLSAQTNRSRNELIGMALQYALDHMELPYMVGTLAGDDTAFLLMRDTEAAESFCKEIRGLL